MENTFGDSAPLRLGGKKPAWEFPHSEITERIIGAAIHIQRQLGPGFLEKVYENALCLEFAKRRILFHQQVTVKILYDGIQVGMHRLDLICENKVVIKSKQ